MKRIIAILFGVLFTLCVSAQEQVDAVTMVSFEQRWFDNNGTLALKNNTDEDIYNVSYTIEYLDMKGNQLDYSEHTSKVDIKPGMTKKVDIPAYEHDRNYSYYLSEADLSSPHKFKVNFVLKDYNTQTTSSETTSSNDLDDTWVIIFTIVLIIVILGGFIGLYVLVGVMAKKRHRSAAIWVLLSLFASPLLMIIILLCIGDSDRGDLD